MCFDWTLDEGACFLRALSMLLIISNFFRNVCYCLRELILLRCASTSLVLWNLWRRAKTPGQGQSQGNLNVKVQLFNQQIWVHSASTLRTTIQFLIECIIASCLIITGIEIIFLMMVHTFSVFSGSDELVLLVVSHSLYYYYLYSQSSQMMTTETIYRVKFSSTSIG